VDGWGVAYYEGRAARIFKDAAPAAESRMLALLAAHQVKSTAVIAHIRRANPSMSGRKAANTHPFEREWNGRSWVFAHNGKLSGLHESRLGGDCHFQPLGETDSELAFCIILDAIVRGIGRKRDMSPTALARTLQPVVNELAMFGEFNFILGNGEHLYVHAHTHLHWLHRTSSTHRNARKMFMLASEPLTAEQWRPLAPGSTHIFQQGEQVLVRSSGAQRQRRQATNPAPMCAAI
jgi:glutamine amidotransferase